MTITPHQLSSPGEIIYPESDGQPMADNTEQFRWIVIIKENLEGIFKDDPNVFVAGDLLWYPVIGHPEISMAPDTLVAFGRPKGKRGSYKQWEENNIAPQAVFEVWSPGNRATETRDKLSSYDKYGVEEYYTYDPERRTLKGYLRETGQLHEINQMNGWLALA